MTFRKKKKVRIPDDPEEAYRKALKTAMNIVGYKDNTEFTLREKLSENAICRIQSYTIETMAAEHDRIFQKLSAERRERRN